MLVSSRTWCGGILLPNHLRCFEQVCEQEGLSLTAKYGTGFARPIVDRQGIRTLCGTARVLACSEVQVTMTSAKNHLRKLGSILRAGLKDALVRAGYVLTALVAGLAGILRVMGDPWASRLSALAASVFLALALLHQYTMAKLHMEDDAPPQNSQVKHNTVAPE